jgi:hypothetical protein
MGSLLQLSTSYSSNKDSSNKLNTSYNRGINETLGRELKNTNNTINVVESKCKRHKETHNLFPKFGHRQRMPMSALRSSQRVGSLSTLILPRCHKDQLGSHYQSPRRGGLYKHPQSSPQSLGAPGQPEPSRGFNPQE